MTFRSGQVFVRASGKRLDDLLVHAALPPLQQGPRESWHGTEQFKPVPESPLCSAAQRVREDARKLGIDYEAEVARTLNRMKNPRASEAPGPHNRRAGPDPFKHAAFRELLLAETRANEHLKRLHGIT